MEVDESFQAARGGGWRRHLSRARKYADVSSKHSNEEMFVNVVARYGLKACSTNQRRSWPNQIEVGIPPYSRTYVRTHAGTFVGNVRTRHACYLFSQNPGSKATQVHSRAPLYPLLQYCVTFATSDPPLQASWREQEGSGRRCD